MGSLDIQSPYRQEGLRKTKEAFRHGGMCTDQDSNPISQYSSRSKARGKDLRLCRRTACEGRQDSLHGGEWLRLSSFHTRVCRDYSVSSRQAPSHVRPGVAVTLCA
jgi:hypothetical protein